MLGPLLFLLFLVVMGVCSAVDCRPATTRRDWSIGAMVDPTHDER